MGKAALKIVQHTSKGLAVIADREFRRGDLICVGLPLEIAAVRDSHSFQVSETLHVQLDEPARLFNHSCEWNMYIRTNELGGYNFYAARLISPGEELVWHYGMTEAESIAVTRCLCKAPCCRGRSEGFKEVPRWLQEKLCNAGIAEYLQKWYQSKRKLAA